LTLRGRRGKRTAMAIVTIVIFFLVFAALNRYEFGRFD
jgi:hypothetical protein